VYATCLFCHAAPGRHDAIERSRLAREMVAHGDAERRAREGKLAELTAAWEDAERTAAIADDPLLPSGVDEGSRRPRSGGSPS
jgi:hypothetical protein